MSSKLFAIVFVILIASQGVLAGKKVNTDFINLISSKTSVKSSQDAIESVLTLLEDLQGANNEAQTKANEAYAQFESAILQDINDFSGLVNSDQKSVATAQADLDAIDSKIQQTEDYLDWNNKRYKANENKLATLAQQRCEANSLFIDTLREYKSALQVLDWVHGQVSEENALIEKKQVGEYAEKLSKYATLFEEQAVSNFVKLGENTKVLSQTNSHITQEEVDHLVHDIAEGVANLIEKLRDSIKGLEEQEIKSANDYADFKTNLLAEQESLKQEHSAKEKFLNSLENDRELAHDVLDKKEDILANSQRILSLTQQQLNEKKSTYQEEKQKRQEENQLLDEAILIYRTKISTVNEHLKKRVNEYVGESLAEEHATKPQEQSKQRKNFRFTD